MIAFYHISSGNESPYNKNLDKLPIVFIRILSNRFFDMCHGFVLGRSVRVLPVPLAETEV